MPGQDPSQEKKPRKSLLRALGTISSFTHLKQGVGIGGS
jgi:hypothetical protein